MPGRSFVYLGLFTLAGGLVNYRLAQKYYLDRVEALYARAEISANERRRKRFWALFWSIFLAAFVGYFFLGAFGLG
jgi:hypothetical protein